MQSDGVSFANIEQNFDKLVGGMDAVKQDDELMESVQVSAG